MENLISKNKYIFYSGLKSGKYKRNKTDCMILEYLEQLLRLENIQNRIIINGWKMIFIILIEG